MPDDDTNTDTVPSLTLTAIETLFGSRQREAVEETLHGAASDPEAVGAALDSVSYALVDSLRRRRAQSAADDGPTVAVSSTPAGTTAVAVPRPYQIDRGDELVVVRHSSPPRGDGFAEREVIDLSYQPGEIDERGVRDGYAVVEIDRARELPEG